METEYLHPMIKGKNVVPFHVEWDEFIVPFPYEQSNPRVPIRLHELAEKAPELAKYYQQNNGDFITLDEAHYICGIMNTKIVYDYMMQSSDSRSFPIRPRIYIPKFDKNNEIHNKISRLSKEAHDKYDDSKAIDKILCKLEQLYLKMLHAK